MNESEFFVRLQALVQRDAERKVQLDALIARVVILEQSLAANWASKGQ